MPTAEPAPLGVLVIDKSRGWTSHDVVAKMRRVTGTRRIGHTGTLDPMATGVLVLCLGRATRLAEYLTNDIKAYSATISFGAETDTYDAEGQITVRQDISDLTLAQIEAALLAFRGKIEQRPPLYSAIKHNGQPLHRLARQGVRVEVAARTVTLYSLDVVAWGTDATLTVDVVCSKGTYIRSLAHDLGQMLGVGAHLSALQRTAAGDLTLADACDLGLLVDGEVDWRERLLSPWQALRGHARRVITPEQAAELRYGRTIMVGEAISSKWFAFGVEHELVAVMAPADEPGQHRPVKVFNAI